MKRIILIALALAALTGCREYDIDGILLQREDISLTVRGAVKMAYEEGLFQLGYNAEKNEFRVFDDNVADWFVLSCGSRPDTEGQTLKADISWTESSTTKSYKNIRFKVKRTDSDGRIWLWSEDEAIGVIVKTL